MNNNTDSVAETELPAVVELDPTAQNDVALALATDDSQEFNKDIQQLYQDTVQGMTDDAMDVLKDFNSSVAEIEGNINLRMQQVLEGIAKLREATAPESTEFQLPESAKQELAILQNSLNNLALLKSQDNLRVYVAANPVHAVVATNIGLLRDQLKKLQHRARQYRIPMTDFEQTFKVMETIGTSNPAIQEHLLLLTYFFRYLNSLKKTLPSMALYMRLSSTLFAMAVVMNRRLVIATDVQQIHNAVAVSSH